MGEAEDGSKFVFSCKYRTLRDGALRADQRPYLTSPGPPRSAKTAAGLGFLFVILAIPPIPLASLTTPLAAGGLCNIPIASTAARARVGRGARNRSTIGLQVRRRQASTSLARRRVVDHGGHEPWWSLANSTPARSFSHSAHARCHGIIMDRLHAGDALRWSKVA